MVSILLLVAALVVLAPMLTQQAGKFAGELPGLIQSLSERLNSWAPQWMKDAVARSGADIQGTVKQFAGSAADWIVSVLKTVLSGGLALVNLVSLLVVTPIVAFYMLIDWDDMIATIDSWVPREHVETVRSLGREINTAMAGFIRGQGTVCLALGVFYAAALSFSGLNFGMAIGFLAGALTFIPYAGAMIGGVLAIGVALVQFWPDYWSISLIVGIFAVGQFSGRKFPVAQARGQEHRHSPRVADVCAVCFRLCLRFCGAAAGRATGCGGWRSLALHPQAISGEQALPRCG